MPRKHSSAAEKQRYFFPILRTAHSLVAAEVGASYVASWHSLEVAPSSVVFVAISILYCRVNSFHLKIPVIHTI